ncbi:MAG: hypothetical protein NC489_25595 [Ruminococcus flavefaciens]|nr:hypothetical protein [Ruminococcus flavefaciens]
MNRDLYSNTEFTDLKRRLNQEIQRRGTYSWWDPLTVPSVGEDRTPPLTLPEEGPRMQISELTYGINNPSEGSIERTRNILYPDQGENPSGENPDGSTPNTSAAQFNVDEIKNFLVGLTKIQDINLFYGRDEIPNLAFRDPKGIEDALINAENSELNRPLAQSHISPIKNDPNGGYINGRHPDYPIIFYVGNVDRASFNVDIPNGALIMGIGETYDGPGFRIDENGYLIAEGKPSWDASRYKLENGCVIYSDEFSNSILHIEYPKEDGQYVMPSGEYDGEEAIPAEGLGPKNFYDDFGAQPGDGNFHPYNPFVSPEVHRDWEDQDHNRKPDVTIVIEGGLPSSRFGTNPRNPQQGNQYRSRPVFGGVKGACNVACTGLCYVTCDNQCSESCATTCWSRCGNACTVSCGNACTGCSTMCYTSCKTKCENSTGYACVKAGAKAVKITGTGGVKGTFASNEIKIITHTCIGCSYSCQFYPNKKTECWDAGCMGKCFTSCNTACSTSCFGGCIDNQSNNDGTYKNGSGRGCSAGCTINCVGTCEGVCQGYCIHSCWNACKASCSDNCEYACSTSCGSGCANICTRDCSDECTSKSFSVACTGGCTSNCKQDCNTNCIGRGCRSICGIDSAGACESNCRLNCMGTACTAMCSDACTVQCSTCINTCGWQCGVCSSQCSTGCSEACNITCTVSCAHNCSENCVYSCTEQCGGCSNLCYSCVGMCIGTCAVKCENGCSNCTNTCGYWCDTRCSRECVANCSTFCITNCSGSCSTFLMSETTMVEGPSRGPTAEGYQYAHPKNRWEERESFIIFNNPDRPYKEEEDRSHILVEVGFDQNRTLYVHTPGELGYVMKQTTLHGGVYTIDQETGEITINEEMLPGAVDVNQPNIDQKGSIFLIILYTGEKHYPEFNVEFPEADLTVTNPEHYGGPGFTLEDGMLYVTGPDGEVSRYELIDGKMIINDPIENIEIKEENIEVRIPFGYESYYPIKDKAGNIIIVIQRDPLMMPYDEEEDHTNGEDQ